MEEGEGQGVCLLHDLEQEMWIWPRLHTHWQHLSEKPRLPCLSTPQECITLLSGMTKPRPLCRHSPSFSSGKDSSEVETGESH